MKRILTAVALVAALGTVGAATAKSPGGMLVIRHQTHGCHAWSYNGNAYKAAQVVHLRRGMTITVVDNDVMSHALVQKSGPATTITSGSMAHQMSKMGHMGATTKATFPKAGVYMFTTKAGEDYPGIKNADTVGEDNVLTLRVIVS